MSTSFITPAVHLRPERESHPRIEDLQSPALLLRHRANTLRIVARLDLFRKFVHAPSIGLSYVMHKGNARQESKPGFFL